MLNKVCCMYFTCCKDVKIVTVVSVNAVYCSKSLHIRDACRIDVIFYKLYKNRTGTETTRMSKNHRNPDSDSC